MESYYFVLVTLGLTVYGQIIIKSRVLHYAERETDQNHMSYLLSVVLDPWVMTGIAAALAAGFIWILAIRNADLSLAYPLMALSFVLVPIFAVILFGEKINLLQVLGLLMIVGGVGIATLTR